MVKEYPTHVPSVGERADLELLCAGALAPVTGFEGPDGLVSLVVPRGVGDSAMSAGGLTLLDAEGARRATLYPAGTYDTPEGGAGLIGDVEVLPYDGSAPFRKFRLAPEAVRQAHGSRYLLVAVDHPLTEDDLATITAKSAGNTIVLLVLYGMETAGLPPSALVRATFAAAEALGDRGLDQPAVVVAPVAPRPGGGARVARRVVDNYSVAGNVWPVGGGALPQKVEDVVDRARRTDADRGLVVFFTGLSGSGKSTIAREVQDHLLEQHDREITSLDGDVVRRHLSDGLSFSAEDRDRNIRRIGWVAAEIARHGGLAVVSPIAPFDATRRYVRDMVVEAGGSFVLVHVATPLDECERRDRKGLYAKARRGEISDFTGISSPYESPHDAELRIDTSTMTVGAAAGIVIDHLQEHGHLSRGHRDD